ncbi:hypothetical protein OG410_41905 [Streptomyces sp. NBC_00659]|uniref:hypothetical protein n=1 Tax=Streptomyces sp. NBC_00659 TaxID=2903669 RepID=UPI002E3650C9|nr:hypothetical protein [Streptomyces sp. NBC_00659]
MTRSPLPQRAAKPLRGVPGSIDFKPTLDAAPEDVAQDMGDLAARVRNLMDLQHGKPIRLPLGGRFFDAVVTASGPEAHAVVDLMDEVQRLRGARSDAPACGPVIEDPERDWLIWLVPPDTHAVWESDYGICRGAPHELVLPPMQRTGPPGSYWLRPCRGDRLVPRWPLADLLDRFQPGPIPRDDLLDSFLGTIS